MNYYVQTVHYIPKFLLTNRRTMKSKNLLRSKQVKIISTLGLKQPNFHTYNKNLINKNKKYN